MLTSHEQNISAPNTPPSAGASGEGILANATTAVPYRDANSPSAGWTGTDSISSHNPSGTDTPDQPRWQMVEYRHKDCDKCHAFIAFNSQFTTDTNNHYEKVVELALNTINVFHENSPRVESVDVSRRFEKATRLVVEVTTSTGI